MAEDSNKLMPAEDVAKLCHHILVIQKNRYWFGLIERLSNVVVENGYGWNVNPRYYTKIAEGVYQQT